MGAAPVMLRTLDRLTTPVCMGAVRMTLVGLLLLVGAAVMLHRISCRSLWEDELFHRQVGTMSLDAIRHYEGFMRFSTGYYVLTRWSEQLFGDPTFSARAPEAAAAALTLLFAYLLGRHLFSTGTGLLAMLVLIANPFFVCYAQENRFYQLGSMCLLATYYFFVAFLAQRRVRHWIGFVAAACLLLHAFPFGFVGCAMLLPVLLLLLLLQWLRRSGSPYVCTRGTLLWLIAAGAVIVLVWMPEPLLLFKQLILSRDALVAVKDEKSGVYDLWW
jgi:4-amino-4-deoxy-L-arabinose transferase-like glycosyltransferase